MLESLCLSRPPQVPQEHSGTHRAASVSKLVHDPVVVGLAVDDLVVANVLLTMAVLHWHPTNTAPPLMYAWLPLKCSAGS